MTTPSDPQAAMDDILFKIGMSRRLTGFTRDEVIAAGREMLAAAGLVITAPDAPASAAPADDTEMRDIIRDWWLNAETREPDAQEPADLPDTLVRYLAARGYVITAPDAAAARPAGDRAKIDWTNDPITRSDIKKWQRALYDLRQTYYHPGMGMHPPYYRRSRAAQLRAIRYLRLTGDHNPPHYAAAGSDPA
jgi:hypothetical protein